MTDRHCNSVMCPDSGSLWSWVDLVDHGLSQGLQHLPLVIIKVSIDLVNRAVLYYPQLTLSFSDEPGIVAHNNHSWTRMESMLVMSSQPVHWCLNTWKTALPVTWTLDCSLGCLCLLDITLTKSGIWLYRVFTNFHYQTSWEHSRINFI